MFFGDNAMSADNKGKVNIDELAPLLVKEPLFMFLCPQQEKREGFIKKYLGYVVPKNQKYGEFEISQGGIVSMLYDPDDIRLKLSGKNSFSLKHSRYALNVLDHQSIVKDVVGIIIPEAFESRVLNVYITKDCTEDEILSVIEQYKKMAREEEFVLIYETLSKRLVPLFEKAGFKTAYARNIMNTRFIQTVMTYNI